MKINKLLIAVTMLGGATLFSSCNDFLKEEPGSFIGPGQVGDSKEAVDVWVSGVYSNWLDNMFRYASFPRVIEMDADYISGPDWLFGHLGAGDFQGEPSYTMNPMWQGPYNLINDANLAIRYIQAMNSVDDDYKNNAIGEMYFQKAFAYFLLVRTYGAVPVFDTDVSNGNSYYEPRRPVAEVYNTIIDLLEKAADMMYNRDNANYKAGHVCAGSAAGLLAKVYATMASAAMPKGTQIIVRTGAPYEQVINSNGYPVQMYKAPEEITMSKDTVAGYTGMDSQELYKKAAEWAKKVIGGEYGLYELSDYSNLWKRNNRDASEFMWAVRSTNGDEIYCTHIHTYYSGYRSSQGSEFIESGGWMGCTNNWYSLFDEEDYRITEGVRHTWRYYYQESYNGCFFYPQSWSQKVQGLSLPDSVWGTPDAIYKATGMSYQYNQSSECLAFTTKYEDVENDATDYADSQWPFLRYADVVLLCAEAENELGNADEAMKYLNLVRKRSNAKLMTTAQTQMRMRSLIVEERAKEFACEGDRRYDLLRWGIYLQAMNAIGGYDDANILKTRTSRNLLFPIPTEELNVNKAITENNPGWN